jgi:hypothetical protein
VRGSDLGSVNRIMCFRAVTALPIQPVRPMRLAPHLEPLRDPVRRHRRFRPHFRCYRHLLRITRATDAVTGYVCSVRYESCQSRSASRHGSRSFGLGLGMKAAVDRQSVEGARRWADMRHETVPRLSYANVRNCRRNVVKILVGMAPQFRPSIPIPPESKPGPGRTGHPPFRRAAIGQT